MVRIEVVASLDSVEALSSRLAAQAAASSAHVSEPQPYRPSLGERVARITIGDRDAVELRIEGRGAGRYHSLHGRSVTGSGSPSRSNLGLAPGDHQERCRRLHSRLDGGDVCARSELASRSSCARIKWTCGTPLSIGSWMCRPASTSTGSEPRRC